ncbi:hypothetical protein RvY_17725 [Ramazzottius varieornatus]|uniref:Uncharacterized protein n=1 Tax=Ramazzottius varieornatus TaxID=947166 RepID=A0A1D1W341_RAMVA|nr:hypothetical protein RvY_17725 [Ramazzottius varieornatus]
MSVVAKDGADVRVLIGRITPYLKSAGTHILGDYDVIQALESNGFTLFQKIRAGDVNVGDLLIINAQ